WSVAMSLFAVVLIWQTYHIRYDPSAVDKSQGQSITFAEPHSGAKIKVESSPVLASTVTGGYSQFCVNFALASDQRFSRDWSVFVHLVNQDGLIVAQRDTFLGQGQWATSLLIPELASGGWCNRFAVKVPD